MTGFWVNGTCAASQADAVAVLNSQFPIVTDAFIHIGYATPSGATGVSLLTYTMNLSVDLAPWITHNNVFNLKACDPALYAPSIFDPVTFAAFWSFAMTFIIGCWLLAKNAGLILAAIRKF